jgi:1-acyl-sn-glycerol-3-phosphate acyltransferase
MRTILILVYFSLLLVLVLPWLILWTILTGNPGRMWKVAMSAVRFSMRIGGVRVRVEGVENIPPGVCVFAANHISNVDPLAFVPAIPGRVSLLVKKELFRIPILSTAMRLVEFVPVDREDKEAAASSVDVAVERLRAGTSFAVYPEGTRSPDGRLRAFKKGAFVMAIQAGVPVVPVSIVGAQTLLRKGDWRLHPGEVSILFGPAVDASKYTMEHRSELLARVQYLVAAGLPEDQKPLPADPSSDPDIPTVYPSRFKPTPP